MSGNLAVASEEVFDSMYYTEQRHEDGITKRNYEPERQDGESDEDWNTRYKAAMALRKVATRLKDFRKYSLNCSVPVPWTRGYMRHMSHYEMTRNYARWSRDKEEETDDMGCKLDDHWDKSDAIAGTGTLNPGAFRRPANFQQPPKDSIAAGSLKQCAKEVQFVLPACCRRV